MDITPGLILQLVVYLLSIGSLGGVILTRLAALEKAVDKHNAWGERVTAVEESAKSAHKRIDSLERVIK